MVNLNDSGALVVVVVVDVVVGRGVVGGRTTQAWHRWEPVRTTRTRLGAPSMVVLAPSMATSTSRLVVLVVQGGS